MSTSIKEIVNANAVVIFAKVGCPYCKGAIEILQTHNANIVYPTDTQFEELEKLTHSESFPNIWINGVYIGGLNDGPEEWMGLKKIIKDGKFENYLNKSAL